MRQEKEIKGTEIRKENIKLLLSADDMIICVGNPHESTTTKKTLELKSDYIKMAGYMVQLVQFNCSVMSSCLWCHGLQHARLPCPSPAPGTCSNSCPLSQWCHPAISFSVIPLLLPPSIFPSIRVFSNESSLLSGGQNIGASPSGSVLPVNIQDWFPLGWTGLYFVTNRRGKGGNSDRFPLVGL